MLAVAAMTVATLMSVAGPWVIGHAVDAGLEHADPAALRFWTLTFWRRRAWLNGSSTVSAST
ncbi:MAG: hypothetical protein V9G19_11010 [Tetrasphaera sp.]